MEIKKGYKITDVGVIPEDWEVKSIGELFSSLRSASITKEMFVEKGCMCVHYGDIHTKYGRILDCDKDVIPNVPISLCKNYPNVEDGDIIMADASEDLEGVGKCVSVINTRGRDIISGLHTILLRDRNNSFYNSFPTYMFSCENVKKGIESYAVGTKVNSISYNSIKDCQYYYPSKKEQQAIADALTKVDNLITSLTKVIEKKKLIKKGAMQKLLSGEMRLDGFEGEWERKQIGKIGITYSGITGKNKSDFGHGTAKYITFLNVLNNPIINTKELELVDISSNENKNKALKGDLFFNVSSETPEEVGICSVLLDDISNLYVNSFCFGFRITDKEVSGIYLSYLFRTSLGRDKMSSIAQGATRYNLSKDYFNEIELTIPPTKAEQTAIANILTTMDNEIEALEKERDKYKCIKQGMMQQLLTGKIRLTCQ